MSDEAIARGSGRDWAAWVELLDAWGARERSHTDIAAYVGEMGVDGWWAQSVTVGYEQIVGLREPGQRRGGGFEGSVSKTFPVPVERLYAAWIDDHLREQWLPTGFLTLRTSQQNRSARFDCSQGILALWFTDKGEKSAVQVTVAGFASKHLADAFRAEWKTRLATLATVLQDL